MFPQRYELLTGAGLGYVEAIFWLLSIALWGILAFGGLVGAWLAICKWWTTDDSVMAATNFLSLVNDNVLSVSVIAKRDQAGVELEQLFNEFWLKSTPVSAQPLLRPEHLREIAERWPAVDLTEVLVDRDVTLDVIAAAVLEHYGGGRTLHEWLLLLGPHLEGRHAVRAEAIMLMLFYLGQFPWVEGRGISLRDMPNALLTYGLSPYETLRIIRLVAPPSASLESMVNAFPPGHTLTEKH